MLKEEKAQATDEQLTTIKRLLTTTEVANILGISAKTVHKLVREGKLGCVQITTKERRFTEGQIRAYIEAKSQPPRTELVDMLRVRQVSSGAKKGGHDKEHRLEKTKDSWASLREEMSGWT